MKERLRTMVASSEGGGLRSEETVEPGNVEPRVVLLLLHNRLSFEPR